jgi:lipopolysaccharide/colanic/teichoic acid biosynthesis glycosyltransferase
LPFLVSVALAIRLESKGPLIFRQQRVGRDGQPFTMFKFRSMFVDAEARKAALMASNEMAGGVLFKMRDDPRVTRVGRFIRRTSIDELPQLFNVLRGDMSLVGPRPPLPSEVAQYTLKDRGRLGAAPGITCIWQVSGRSEIPFPQQVEMDLDYIQGQSLAGDVRLLLKTVPALVRGRGAY